VPILMTATVTSLGLLPLALEERANASGLRNEGNRGGSNSGRGICPSTALNLPFAHARFALGQWKNAEA